MPDNETDIITELETEEARRVVGDGKHQFDEKGLKYEKKGRLVVWLLIFLAATIGMYLFLFNTEQGRSLLNIDQETTNNNFPVSYAHSSSESDSSSSESDTNTTSSSFTVSELEFTDEKYKEVLELMEADISDANNYADSEVIFEKYDSPVEFGVNAKLP